MWNTVNSNTVNPITVIIRISHFETKIILIAKLKVRINMGNVNIVGKCTNYKYSENSFWDPSVFQLLSRLHLVLNLLAKPSKKSCDTILAKFNGFHFKYIYLYKQSCLTDSKNSIAALKILLTTMCHQYRLVGKGVDGQTTDCWIKYFVNISNFVCS